MIIEKLRQEDLPGLKTVYEEGFEGSSSDLQSMTACFEEVIRNNPNYYILCARINNLVIGSVMGVVCYELFGSCKPFMVVENVAVLKEYRRKGVARKLMEELEQYARQCNCTTILFVSSEHRKGAHALYESLGYGQDKVNGYRKRLTA